MVNVFQLEWTANLKHYETHNMVNNADNIGSTFNLRINFTRMKKTTKTHRDNKAIQRNIDWLSYKTRLFKNRALNLLRNDNHYDNFIRYYYPHRYSFRRCMKRLAINQIVFKKVSSRLKNRR